LVDQSGHVGLRAARMWLCSSSMSIIKDRDPLVHLDILTVGGQIEFPRTTVTLQTLRPASGPAQAEP
jgi:hypothetical protein